MRVWSLSNVLELEQKNGKKKFIVDVIDTDVQEFWEIQTQIQTTNIG